MVVESSPQPNSSEPFTAQNVRVGLLETLPSGYQGGGTNPIFQTKDGSL